VACSATEVGDTTFGHSVVTGLPVRLVVVTIEIGRPARRVIGVT
jgi:hypothetical protein